MKAPVPFVARSFQGLGAEECAGADLHGEVLSSLKIRWFLLVPPEGNIDSFDPGLSVSHPIMRLTAAVVFPLELSWSVKQHLSVLGYFSASILNTRMLDWLLCTVTKLLTIAPATSKGGFASELISRRCLTP